MSKSIVHPAWIALMGCALVPFAMAANGSHVGVWQGTLGKHSIVACFASDTEGRYYYLKNASDLFMQKQAPAKMWEERPYAEGNLTGHWDITSEGNQLKGKWVATAGNKSLPLQLQRITSADNDGMNDCLNQIYNQPRLALQKVTMGPTVKQGKKHYRTYSVENRAIQALELSQPGAPGRDTINALLRKRFDSARLDRYTCLTAGAGKRGGSFTSHQAVELWSSHWLVVSEASEFYCGGAYPDTSFNATTYDLDTGRTVDLQNWFAKDAWKQDNGYPTLPGTSPLGQTVLKHSTRSSTPQCKDVLVHNEWYEVWPTAKGLTFNTRLPHAVKACSSRMTVPYDELKPFLSPAGIKAIEELQATR